MMLRRASLVAALAALAVALGACGGDDEGAAGEETMFGETFEETIVDQPVTFQLSPVDDGVSGTVTLEAHPDDRDRTLVRIEVAGEQEALRANPAHIHRGTCDDFDAGDPFDTLGDVDFGVLEGTVAVSMLELLEGEFVVDVHGSEVSPDAGVIACGEVPDKSEVDVGTSG